MEEQNRDVRCSASNPTSLLLALDVVVLFTLIEIGVGVVLFQQSLAPRAHNFLLRPYHIDALAQLNGDGIGGPHAVAIETPALNSNRLGELGVQLDLHSFQLLELRRFRRRVLPSPMVAEELSACNRSKRARREGCLLCGGQRVAMAATAATCCPQRHGAAHSGDAAIELV